MSGHRVLLVEDNAADVLLVEEAFGETGCAPHLRVFGDGESAVAWLAQQAENGAALPDLMLLDLNLPGKSGHEVLATVKGDPRLRRLPVVILTTSAEQAEVEAALDRHANCYVVKPPDLDGFLRVVRGLEDFWLTLASLPAPGHGQSSSGRPRRR